MPKIAAYKCPFTKKLFETRSNYRLHLLKLRKAKAKARARRKIARARRKARSELYETIHAALGAARTIPEVEQAFIDQFTNIMIHQYGGDNLKRIAIANGFEMLKLDIDRVHYSNSVSNTHACPRSGVTNWGGRKEGAPRGYPGFSGHIEYTCTEPEDFDGWFVNISDALSFFGLNTGTGGGRGDCPKTGGRRYYYDVKLFLDDFPGLAEHVEEVHEDHKRVIFMKKLKGERIHDPVYDSIIG